MYAFPKEGDPAFSKTGQRSVFKSGGFSGIDMGKQILYVQMARGRENREFPSGQVVLRDVRTQQSFMGIVETSMFERTAKGGYTVFRTLVAFGTLSDPSSFLEQ